MLLEDQLIPGIKSLHDSKHPQSTMVCGAMSANGTTSLYFLNPDTKYLDLLKVKSKTNMVVHDGAPCHRSKLMKNYLQKKNVDALDWPGNNQHLKLIEN